MKWEEKTLDMLGEISRGKSKHRPRNDSILFGGPYPFIQTADVKKANLYITEYDQTYSEIGLAQSKLWNEGTLCITIAANIADTAILGMKACFPDSIMGFVPYEGVSDAKFVKYMFDILQKECKNISQGTAQDNLSWEKLSTIKFRVPDYDTQIRIVKFLATYDDLIENNQKQIKLLEEAAQRLYKEWFVDLRFPGHENVKIVDGVPEGWERKNLSDVFSYTRGKSYTGKEIAGEKGIMLVNLNNIQAFGGYKYKSEKIYAGKYSDAHIVETGDLIMGVTDMTQERRLVGSVALVPKLNGISIISMDLIKIVPKSCYKSYLYMLFRFGNLSKAVSAFANGVNVLHLKPESIMHIEITVPAHSIQAKFDSIIVNILNMIELMNNKNENLQEARDRLLPKLISGEIEL